MLNRRILRVKVMQALYAYFQADDADMAQAEKKMMLSLQRVYELYLHYLILPIELANVAEIQMEEAKRKVLPTEEDLNPSRKFVDSYVMKALAQNSALQQKVAELNVSWSSNQDLLRRLWKQIKASDLYKQYLSEEDTSLSQRKFIEKIYSNFLIDNQDFYQYFQERSIYWDFEDSDYAINMAMRYIGKIKSEERFKGLPQMYKDTEEDEEFVKNLFRKTIVNNKENAKLIDEKIRNWDMDRIAVLDVLLMKMAMTEFAEFQSIPVKVSMNEYIDISKLFSSPKSKVFINGVLDKILAQLKREKLINKTGRGLIQ